MAENDNINLEITEAIVEAVSPTATVSKVGDTATITVTDKNGTTTASIKDGDKGDKGDQGDKGDKGDKGDTGNTGATGATPELSIGTVSTLGPSEPATANITGTAEQPILSLGIPKGVKGDTGNTGAAAGFGTVSASVDANVGTPAVSVTASGPDTAKNIAFAFSNLKGAKGDTGATGDTTNIAAEFDSSTDYSAGDYAIYNDLLYVFTVDHAAGAWDGSDAEQVTVGENMTGLGSEVDSAKATLDTKADKDGNYPELGAGQLLSDTYTEDKKPYLFRALPYDSTRLYDKIVGGTVAWNQLVRNGDFADGTTGWASIRGTLSASNNVMTVTRSEAGFVSLTCNISNISNHVCYVRFMASVSDTGLKMQGAINYSSINNSKFMSNKVFSAANTMEKIETIFTPSTDATVLRIGVDMSSINGSFSVKEVNIIDLTAYFSQTAIAGRAYTLEQGTAGAGIAWLKSYGFIKDGYISYNAGSLESVQATAHVMRDEDDNIIATYPLDSDLTLRGIFKVDADNNIYADGDTDEDDGTVTRKYGIVDLGEQTWTLVDADKGLFRSRLENHKIYTQASDVADMICPIYTPANASQLYNASKDKIIGFGISGIVGNYLMVVNKAYSDASTFTTAMSGVYLVYELATPTTEEADPFTNPQVCTPNGTEEYTTSNGVPVGHETKYLENLKGKIENMPSIPNAPTTDGSYILGVTVASGVPTYGWVEE